MGIKMTPAIENLKNSPIEFAKIIFNQTECSSIIQEMWDKIDRSVALPSNIQHIGMKAREKQENYMYSFLTKQLTWKF